MKINYKYMNYLILRLIYIYINILIYVFLWFIKHSFLELFHTNPLGQLFSINLISPLTNLQLINLFVFEQ
jgi:hypothetical protein